MKKILYSSIIALAGLFAVSCETVNEKVLFNPGDASAPTVGEITGCVLDKEGEAIELQFGASDFNLDVASGYELQASLTEDFETAKKVTADIAEGKASFKPSALNSVLLSMGVAIETEALVYFRMASFLVNEKNAAVADTYVYSNVVSAKFTTYNAVVPEADQYDHVWVIGDYCGWAHDKTQFLYNYKKDKTTYTGVVDFGEKAANGFKITGVAAWQDDVNWGSEAQAEEAEQASIQLVAGGGSKDIKAYSMRFYHFEFNTSSLVLKKNFGFNKMGVIGLNDKWGDTDDIIMNYNPVLVRFYVDIDVAADTRMKFRADGAWAIQWGIDDKGLLKASGSDIPVKAGKYRVYLDINKEEFSLDETMFGKPESGVDDVAPEPEPVKWYVKGNFNNWGNAEPTIEMTNSGDLWTAKKVKLAAIDEFKVASSENVWAGGPEENADSQIEPVTNPYKVYKPTIGEAFETGDKNVAVGVEGEYDIVYDTANNTITVSVAKLIEGWAVVGTITGWADGADIAMTQNGAIWSATNIALTAKDQFKIRKDGGWAVNRGAAGEVEPFVLTIGESLPAVAGGKNLAVPADGNYDIFYHEANEEIYVLEKGSAAPEFGNTWYLVGTFNGWTVGDANYMMKKSGEYFVFKGLTFTEEAKVKFNAGSWDVNRGGLAFAANAAFSVEHNGSDLVVPAGTYDVYLSLDEATAYFMTDGKTPGDAGTAPEPEPTPDPTSDVWYLVGSFNSWTVADEAYKMNKAGDFFVFNNLVLEGENIEVKFNAGNWDVNRGGETFAANEAIDVTNGGKNLVVPAGTYDVYLSADQTKAYFMTEGKTPEGFDPAPAPENVWYLVGGFNSWTVADEAYKMVKEGEYFVFKNFTLSGNAEVKFNAGGWDVNRGGSVFAQNAPLAVTNGGSNLNVPAGTYDVYLSLDETTAYFMTDGKTPADAVSAVVTPHDISKIVCGLAGSFNGEAHWDNPPTEGRVASFVSSEGKTATYKLSNFALKAGDQLKLILDGKWCGGTLNADFSVTVVLDGGENVTVPEGIEGNFDITIKFDYELVNNAHTYTNIAVQIAPAA